jgi:hypothetical protein
VNCIADCNVPFYYDVKVPDLGNEKSVGKYTFVRWLLNEKGNIEAGTAFAIVSDGSKTFILRNAGPGFFTPWNVHEGDEVSAGQPIARITTDGDLIPYGRPYVTFSELPHDKS